MMLEQWLHQILEGYTESELTDAYQQLSHRYRQSNYKPGFQNEAEVKAYAAARMPATVAAVTRTLKELPQAFLPTTVLDLGAGTGAASLGVLQHFPSIKNLTLVEQDGRALACAKTLIQLIKKDTQVKFIQQSLCDYTDDKPIDLIILSYVLNELSIAEQQAIIEKLMANQSCYILILMPGTPVCFQQLLILRKLAIEAGYFVAAPCPHQQDCPMATASTDWCHFKVRLPRTRTHRLFKEATLNFEDEKFCYLLLSKNAISTNAARIVKNPLHRSGHSLFDVCEDGELKRVIIGRKHKSLYKTAVKLSWGDIF
jgi:ribosomal protein RSM22 (predicted rRNA methylase)